MRFEKVENIALAVTAVLSIVLWGTAVVSIVILASLLSEFAVAPLHAQTRPAVELQAAMTKEQVDGDLKTAIAAYQKIAADKSAPRDVRAKALLHLAGCYEKLGQQAQNVYQQIVRDFADQPAATQARVRLAALTQADHPAAPATMTQRKIERPLGRMGGRDTDGHRAVYYDKTTGELIYGDLAGKSNRVIFKTAKPDNQSTGTSWPLGWFPSRDFSMVGLQIPKSGKPETYAVVNTDGTGYREIASLDGFNGCWNWSWDNRYILLCSESEQGTARLLKISVADGKIQELMSLKAEAEWASFSPDGRFVAFQVHESPAAWRASRILIVPAEGGEPQTVYEERSRFKFIDWTADGRYLAIGSARSGKQALHLLPIKDGKAAGDPLFVRSGNFEYDGQSTAAGALVYETVKPGGAYDVYTASLDTSGRPDGWKRLDLHLDNPLNPMPDWSSDGNQIVYVAGSEDAGQTGGSVVHVRNLSTGKDRQVYHLLGQGTCTWAIQLPKLFCTDQAEKTEVLSIGVDSGEIARLGTIPGPWFFILCPSSDNQALYLIRLTEEQHEKLTRWEIATQQETALANFTEISIARAFVLPSRNERWLLRLTNQAYEVRPMAGGDWKALVSHKGWGWHATFTPDGEWLVYQDVDPAGKQGLFRVATAGGKPERLGDFPTTSRNGSMEISPDGRKIMVAAGEFEDGLELWSLENFVPPAPKP